MHVNYSIVHIYLSNVFMFKLERYTEIVHGSACALSFFISRRGIMEKITRIARIFLPEFQPRIDIDIFTTLTMIVSISSE